MTRAERIKQYLITYPAAWDRPEAAAELLAIADDRELLSLKDVAARLNRNATTILSWLRRDQHEIPAAIAFPASGMIWDGEEIEAWITAHPELKCTEDI